MDDKVLSARSSRGEQHLADGEGVWSWRPCAGAKSAGDDLQATVTLRSWTPGESSQKSQTVAQGRPEFRRTCGGLARVLPSFAREAAGAFGAPGFPCALCLSGVTACITRADHAAGMRPLVLSDVVPRACDASSIPEEHGIDECADIEPGDVEMMDRS